MKKNDIVTGLLHYRLMTPNKQEYLPLNNGRLGLDLVLSFA